MGRFSAEWSDVSAAEGARFRAVHVLGDVPGLADVNITAADGIRRLVQDQITLETYIRDVVGFIEAKELDQVVLRIYVLADNWDPSPFRFFARNMEASRGWPFDRAASPLGAIIIRCDFGQRTTTAVASLFAASSGIQVREPIAFPPALSSSVP